MSTHLPFDAEKFAQLVAIGKTQSAAYREAFPKSKKWKPETVWSAASRLAADSKVSARIDELREEMRQSANMTLQSHLEELERIKRVAHLSGEVAAMLKAEELRGKASGFYVTKVEGGRPGEFDQADLETIKRRVAERAARLGMPIPKELLKLPAPATAK